MHENWTELYSADWHKSCDPGKVFDDMSACQIHLSIPLFSIYFYRTLIVDRKLVADMFRQGVVTRFGWARASLGAFRTPQPGRSVQRVTKQVLKSFVIAWCQHLRLVRACLISFGLTSGEHRVLQSETLGVSLAKQWVRAPLDIVLVSHTALYGHYSIYCRSFGWADGNFEALVVL